MRNKLQIKIRLLILLLFLSLSLNLYFYLTLPIQKQQANLALNSPMLEIENKTNNNPFNTTVQGTKPQVNNVTEQVHALFNNQQYDLAIDLYSDIVNQDETLADNILNTWLIKLNNRLNSHDNDTVAAFTSSFFNYNAYHIRVMQLEAKRLEHLIQFPQAIKLYKDIIDNSFNLEIEQHSENQIHLLVQKQYALLSQQGLWKETLHFLEQVLFDEADYQPYLLLLSKTKIELNQLSSAQEILLQLAESEESPAQVDALLQQVQSLLLGETAIPLVKHGEHFIVNGQFDSQSQIQLMIDTGASLSVLSNYAFENLPSWLNPVFSRQIDMNTAGGTVNTPVYLFEQFQINGYQVKSIEFAVMDLETLDKADGLLGMNFLKHFAFQIDQLNNQLILGVN